MAVLLEGALRGIAFISAFKFTFVANVVGTGNLFGDLLALLMTVSSGLFIVMVRAFRNTPVVWAGAISAFVLFILGWFVTDPLAVSARDAVLLDMFGLSFAFATILRTEGSRRVPASETGLIGTTEAPFAILFAFLFLGEIPPVASIVGAASFFVQYSATPPALGMPANRRNSVARHPPLPLLAAIYERPISAISASRALTSLL